MDEIMVSVVCIAYNHEKYIRDALDGFVNQKTNFKFEVLINDDASTDGTADIIREYEKKYPEIIKPIYQTENQYSKGIRITNEILLPKAKGKYVAHCEGDDYWCDENKLQMQVDYMESHPECSACVHNTLLKNMSDGTERVMFCETDRNISVEECIKSGAGGYQTSSLMYRREYIDDNPEFMTSIKGVGDYPRAIYLALSGNIYYFGKIMSVYRFGTPGSWTVRVQRNTEKMVVTTIAMIKMLEMANEYSEYKYDEYFRGAIERHRFDLAVLEKRYKDIIGKKYRDVYSTLPKSEKIKYFILSFMPFLSGIRGKIGKIVKNESR